MQDVPNMEILLWTTPNKPFNSVGCHAELHVAIMLILDFTFSQIRRTTSTHINEHKITLQTMIFLSKKLKKQVTANGNPHN